jgi:hypothetical protein
VSECDRTSCPIGTCDQQKMKGVAPREKHAESIDPCIEKCHEYACKIQLCLAKNREQESACSHAIKNWKDCCVDVTKATR